MRWGVLFAICSLRQKNMNKTDNPINLPPSLVEIVSNGDAVLVIGNQLSIEVGLPSMNDVMEILANRISLPQQKRTDLPTVARYYENKYGRQDLINLVRKYIGAIEKEISANHRRLNRLGVRTWITTNYDNLLEQTLTQCNQTYNIITQDQGIPYTSSVQTTLVKLHGSCNQPETLIVTRQDYDTYFRRFPRIKEKLNSLLVDKTFLFVGYTPSDPSLNWILKELAFDLQQHQRPAYIVLFDTDEFTLQDLRLQHIFVIDTTVSGAINATQHLGVILDALTEQVEQTQYAITKRPQPTGSVSPEQVQDITDLVEAMGYRIVDKKIAEETIYFLCRTKWMGEIRQEIIHFVGGQLNASTIACLNEAAVNSNANRGILITVHPISAYLQGLVRIRERLRCYTINEFTNLLADFRSYLQQIILEYETSEVSQYYVPIGGERDSEQGRSAEKFDSIEKYLDEWLEEPGRNHLSILGEFGSGKTWLCKRYSYLASKRYLTNPDHNRIPILINLRDYSRAYNIEQMITDVIVNRYQITLASGYKTFQRLNNDGRLLIIFDGFDEMEQQVSDYRAAVENFWELSTIVHPNSKVILTCRTTFFRHRAEENRTLVPSSPFSASVIVNDEVIDMRDRHEFEVIYLQELSDDHIRLLLQKRFHTTWEDAYKKIKAVKGLQDLASRPVMLDIIATPDEL